MININVCEADTNSAFGKIGWFFAFFGDGTTCRCCLGMRTVLAFILGLAFGGIALYNKEVALFSLGAFVFAFSIIFVIWLLIEFQAIKEQKELEEELKNG